MGGDGSPGAAGNVGGYNTFWIDRGNDAFRIDGQWRTSIIVDPPDGRQPPLTAAARERLAELAGSRRPNTGTAWWMIENGPQRSRPPTTTPKSARSPSAACSGSARRAGRRCCRCSTTT